MPEISTKLGLTTAQRQLVEAKGRRKVRRLIETPCEWAAAAIIYDIAARGRLEWSCSDWQTVLDRLLVDDRNLFEYLEAHNVEF